MGDWNKTIRVLIEDYIAIFFSWMSTTAKQTIDTQSQKAATTLTIISRCRTLTTWAGVTDRSIATRVDCSTVAPLFVVVTIMDNKAAI
jgi:hypothetical protein